MFSRAMTKSSQGDLKGTLKMKMRKMNMSNYDQEVLEDDFTDGYSSDMFPSPEK